MTIIELLNKIANGEDTPKEIKYDGYTFKKANESYIEEDGDNLTDHICYDYSNLNDKVEIIEEDKKIARLNQDNFQCVSNLEVSGQSANYFEYGIEDEIRDIVDKINEIIDYLMENKQ